MNERVIRALCDEETITVYQAYHRHIAETAVASQTFVSPPFKKERMTWIKPSFLWMMYRSGWAAKENQEHILAVKIKRSGFEWALQHACLSHFEADVHASPEDWKEKLSGSSVRVQWDPEKDIFLQALPYRSIQIGLSGVAVEKYCADWIVQIEDITEYSKNIHQLLLENKVEEAKSLLPLEQLYPLSDPIALNIKLS